MDYHVVTALIEPPRQNSSRSVNQEPVYFKSGEKKQWVLFCHPYKGRSTCKPSTRRPREIRHGSDWHSGDTDTPLWWPKISQIFKNENENEKDMREKTWLIRVWAPAT